MKQQRKAEPGGRIIWLNIARNWLHQAISYMDTGELVTRIVIEAIEIILVSLALTKIIPTANTYLVVFISFMLAHTWNWATNGLFWALIIFAFPNLRNPGADNTVTYLNEMAKRISKINCISGIAIYGSVTRGSWHDRSDIDIRFLRKPGIKSILCATIITMSERFIAFISRQPMDLYLADNIDFLYKMRSDEIPLILLDTDSRLRNTYPSRKVREVSINDLNANKIT